MQSRFVTLDGLRGIAAIYVVMYHGRAWFGDLTPRACYLAVDFFFVLSGFVIAAAYSRKLENGLSLANFTKIRLIRIYPLYIIGSAPSLIVLIGSFLHRSEISEYNAMVWRALPFALFMLPSPTVGDLSINYYPFNNPAWTLFFEILINVAFAASFRFWPKRLLAAVAFVGAAALLIHGGDLDGGWNWGTFFVGLARVAFSFPIGVFIHELHGRGFRAPAIPSWICVVAFTGLLLVPANFASVLAVLVGFPLIVAVAASSNPTGALERVFTFLGAISFAIYAIHLPILRLVEAIINRLDIHANPLIIGTGFLAVVIAASYLLDRCYDGPARRRLTRFFVPDRDRSLSREAEGAADNAPPSRDFVEQSATTTKAA